VHWIDNNDKKENINEYKIKRNIGNPEIKIIDLLEHKNNT